MVLLDTASGGGWGFTAFQWVSPLVQPTKTVCDGIGLEEADTRSREALDLGLWEVADDCIAHS